MIGMGIPLNRISDIRRLFQRDPMGDDKIDFENDPQMTPSGQSIVLRLPEVFISAFSCKDIKNLNFASFQLYLAA